MTFCQKNILEAKWGLLKEMHNRVTRLDDFSPIRLLFEGSLKE
jgi:hypothetical protein